MCGICGIVYADGRPIQTERLIEMRDRLRHRGPDGEGLWQAPGVGFGHRRLAIIDLSPAGHQPMSNEDGTVWVTYNGEVYNFAELRDRLMAAGHVMRSRTDTEVLVHLYEDVGTRLVDELRGMFAFALWDVRRRVLVLARDRLGVKPLYYAQTPEGHLVFASEIKALPASGLVSLEPDPTALPEYLANRYTTGDTTLYRGVRRLLPGHVAVWEAGRLRVTPYWDYPVGTGAASHRDAADLVEEFGARLRESVRLRMISDAPIGVFLSGGLDSSAVAAFMAAESAAPIRTFSVAFAEREANEFAYARTVAHAIGAEHHEVLVTPEDFLDALPRLVWHEDEPIAFPSSVPLFFVSQLAAQSAKVVLTGEGSDELLGGYGKYWRALYNLRAGRVYERVPRVLRDWVRRGIGGLPASRFAARLQRTFLCRPADIESLFLGSFSVFDVDRQERLLTPEFRRAAVNGHPNDPYAGHRAVARRFAGASDLEQLLALDVATYLRELLMKQDQMSMAASIESRVPFLDHHLVEFVAQLPPGLKLRGLTGKLVLRRSMERVLPAAILERRKLGFPTPVGQWLRGRYTRVLDAVLLSPEATARGIFQRREVERLIREHRSGPLDHTERLWALLVTELWMRTCVEGERFSSGWWS